MKKRLLLRTSLQTLFLGGLIFATISCTKKENDTDNTLNLVIRQNIKGLDPIFSNDIYSSTAIVQIYEGLLQYSYLKRPFQLEPALAEALPTVSSDGLIHTFKIRPGVHFQDDPCFKDGKGREVVAEDFIYSFKRLGDPANVSDGHWIFDDKVKGFNEWVKALKDGKGNFDAPISGFQAPDPHTLVISLTSPYYQLGYVLAMSFATVVPKEAVDKYGKEFINHPVGTGPFQFESWVRNSKLTLHKNPTFHGQKYPSEGEAGDKEKGLLEDAGKDLPLADKVVMTELAEDSPRWQNFLKGNFDYSEIPADAYDKAIKDKKLVPELTDKGVKLNINSAGDVTYTGLNMKDPLLGKNKHLRKALSLSQDSATFVHNFYNDRAIVAQSPVPPEFSSYDPNFKNPYSQFNVEKAKEELKAAGFPEGKGLQELVYECLADSKSRQIAEFFAQNAAAIGIKIQVEVNTWPQLQSKIKSGKAQIFGIAWFADYPDEQSFYQLFYGKNISPGPNDSNFVNADFDKLYEKALLLPAGSARDELYKKMRDIVVEEVPWIYEGHRVNYRVYYQWLHNLKPLELIPGAWVKYLRVDPKARAEMKAKL